VNILGPKIVVESQEGPSWEEPSDSFRARRRKAAGERVKARLERDVARGYSINVKQVILAFAVEFVIIGLILTSQFVYAVQLPSASRYTIVQTLLFPIALAMVELARVPLAIAVRIQKSWNIQLAALLGVSCAVVVTSASLYQIGNFTFNPRLETVHAFRERLDLIQEHKTAFVAQKQAAQDRLDHLAKDFYVLDGRYKSLASQLTVQPSQNCNVVSTPGVEGTPGATKQVCRDNPALKPLRAELEGVKVKLNELEAARKEANSEFSKIDPRVINEESDQAAKQYRDAVLQSPAALIHGDAL
jgi:hypothetical protein